MKDTPSYLNFDEEAYSWKPGVDYKKHPELYRVDKGKQGVLICEPYLLDCRFAQVNVLHHRRDDLRELRLKAVEDLLDIGLKLD